MTDYPGGSTDAVARHVNFARIICFYPRRRWSSVSLRSIIRATAT